KAGLPCETEDWSYVNPKNGKTVSGIRTIRSHKIIHDFRRTAVRNFNNERIPDKIAMQMTGHETRAVYDDYRIVPKADLDMAREILDRAQKGLADSLSQPRPAVQVARQVQRIRRTKSQK